MPSAHWPAVSGCFGLREVLSANAASKWADRLCNYDQMTVLGRPQEEVEWRLSEWSVQLAHFRQNPRARRHSRASTPEGYESVCRSCDTVGRTPHAEGKQDWAQARAWLDESANRYGLDTSSSEASSDFQ